MISSRGDGIMIDYQIIGKRIQEKRTEKNITQEQLAEKLSVSAEYISRLENAKSQINLKRLAEISDFLEIPIEYFIAGTVTTSLSYQSKEFSEFINGCSPEEKSFILKVIQEMKLLN